MMKNLIKLLVLAGTLLSIGAFAQFKKGTEFNFYFPYYAAIYTNVTQVDFFNTSTSTGTEGALYQNGISGYYEGTQSGVVACLNAASNLPTSYTVNGSGGSNTLSCKFAPSYITKDVGFKVNGYNNASKFDTDGELLIITNASTFNVSVSTSGSINSATVNVIPDYIDTTPAIANGKSAQAVSSAQFVNKDAYSTQYRFAKVIPLLFYAEADVLGVSQITTAESMTVTWQVSAP